MSFYVLNDVHPHRHFIGRGSVCKVFTGLSEQLNSTLDSTDTVTTLPHKEE